MVTNTYPRRIQPSDALLYDAQGNLIGLRSGTSGDEAIFGMSTAEAAAAAQALVSGAGISADGVALYDATTTASATCTVGSATASFGAADIGKPCVVLSYTNTVPTPRYGTITAVASSTSCTADRKSVV